MSQQLNKCKSNNTQWSCNFLKKYFEYCNGHDKLAHLIKNLIKPLPCCCTQRDKNGLLLKQDESAHH